MGTDTRAELVQISQANNSLIQIPVSCPDTLSWWMEQYFGYEVTTSIRSQREQRRDLGYFIQFMVLQQGSEQREHWVPRLSGAFQEQLRVTYDTQGRRKWSDRTINRMMAHLKTFARWIHRLRPFPLGDPMHKIRMLAVGTGLEIERALTPAERRRFLDAADQIVTVGGRSRDRHRYRRKERPVRKGFRPYRNRAIVYTLIETGMRRGAVPNIDLYEVDFKRKTIAVREKGGLVHNYKISNEGLQAIQDYIDKERAQDNELWQSPALFLTAKTRPTAHGRLSSWAINDIWNDLARFAGIEGKTPHSARHAMGRYIIDKTGNIAAVQRQLGHKNPVYSMQYARITDNELEKVLNERDKTA